VLPVEHNIEELDTLGARFGGRLATRSGHSLVLFDDFVGEVEDRRWDRQAERVGRLEVDN